MTAYAPTPFVEANALLSMQAKDGDSVQAALSQLNPQELADLSLVCSALEKAIAIEYARQSHQHIFNAPSWAGPNPYDDVCKP